jgi:hypothetical protein
MSVSVVLAGGQRDGWVGSAMDCAGAGRWRLQASFSCTLKIIFFYSFRHINLGTRYELVNIGKKPYLHSLVGNHDINLLSLVSPRLNNIYQIR